MPKTAARPGPSHAITLTREGVDIIAVDIAAQIGWMPYPMVAQEDLAQHSEDPAVLAVPGDLDAGGGGVRVTITPIC